MKFFEVRKSIIMWFDGPIEAAISKAKTEKCLLIIFIAGNDENSHKMVEYWENDSVKELVTNNSCVALKLNEGSESAKQFAQVYPVVNIPICFFITPKGGVPLEVLLYVESIDDFKGRLTKTIEIFRNGYDDQKVPPVKDSSNVDASRPSGFELDGAGAGSSDKLEDRIQTAQQLIKERQEAAAREAEEKARSDEMKRREAGKHFQKAQERVKEAEILQAAQDQKKAKKDDKEYLKKLREQIAADRAEKAAKYSNVQVEQQRENDEKRQQKVQADEQQRIEEEERRKRYSLLQFRLPDGSALKHQFDGSANFDEARLWITREASLVMDTFILVQMFPRREFTAADGSRTLSELGLTPNAVLMVLPTSNTRSGPKPSGPGLFGWVWSLVATPLRYVYNLLYSFIAGQPRPITGTNTTVDPRQQAKPAEIANSAAGPSASNSNISRFRNKDDAVKPGDDNATWNGNSTQQL